MCEGKLTAWQVWCGTDRREADLEGQDKGAEAGSLELVRSLLLVTGCILARLPQWRDWRDIELSVMHAA